MSLLLLLQSQGTPPTPQVVDGTLTMSGALTTQVLTPLAVAGTLTMSGALTSMVMKSFVALAGTLTMAGAVAAALRTVQAVVGTLTGAGAVGTTYTPPTPGGDDAILTRLRRNQTD